MPGRVLLSPSILAVRQAELHAFSTLCRVTSSLLPCHCGLQNIAVATQKNQLAQPSYPTQKS